MNEFKKGECLEKKIYLLSMVTMNLRCGGCGQISRKYNCMGRCIECRKCEVCDYYEKKWGGLL